MKQKILGSIYLLVIAFFIAVLFGLGTPGCGKAKMRVVNNPAPAPVPTTCPQAPTIKLFECYQGKKLILRAYATSVLDLRTCDSVKCYVK